MKRIPLLGEFSRPLLFAHRGCSSLAPENTMAAFRKGRETGAPGIELDIHACASGELVVIHDDTFSRIAGDSREVEALSFQEIKSIDAGSFFSPDFSGERPPLLDYVLEEFCPDLYIDIELKTNKKSGDPLPGLVAQKIKQFGEKIEQSITVSSFNPFAIRAFKKLNPRVPTAIIWDNNPAVPFILRRGGGRRLSHCDYLKPAHGQVSGFSCFKFGVLEKRPLIPWTVDDPALARQMLKAGCQGVITNRPQDMGALFGH